MSIKEKLIKNFGNKSTFSLEDAYSYVSDKPKTTIRGRILDNLGICFERVSRGVYRVITNTNENCILIEGNGRDLSFLPDNSIDCIITDHPWADEKANKGGSRNFAEYESFKYDINDFKEKARVLKEGCFLVEFIPSESESNYEYLYQIKTYAKKNGLLYYSKVPWIKGTFVSNTGRKSKNSEDILIFSKGKARNMRPDAKKDKAEPGVKHFMSGANGMLPTDFNVQPPLKTERIHQAEKPSELIEKILYYLTFEGEIILDQFAGSGCVGEACIKNNRSCILIEKDSDFVELIKQRLNLNSLIFNNQTLSLT